MSFFHLMWRNRDTGELASPWDNSGTIFGDEWELIEINTKTGEVRDIHV